MEFVTCLIKLNFSNLLLLTIVTMRDAYCIYCILFGYAIYGYLFYKYFMGDIRIMKQNIPTIIAKKLPFSFNFTNYKLNERRDNFISWMLNPDSLCWNINDNDTTQNTFIATVAIQYDNITKIHIRQNRMFYAMINNYIYCEYTEYTNNISIFSKHDNISKYDNQYQRWYKLFFIQYLLNYHREKLLYLIWLDADTIILNLNFSINDNIIYLSNDSLKYSMYIQSDRNSRYFVNSGVLILKNTDWTRNELITFCVNDDIIFNTFKVSPQRDQYALIKYHQTYPIKWKNNVKIINGLQIHGNNVNNLEIKDNFVWHLNSGGIKAKTSVIECTLIQYCSKYFLSLVYSNNKNRDEIFQTCLKEMYYYA